MTETQPPSTYDSRITLLNQYRDAILRWFNGNYEPEGKDGLRSRINRSTKAAESAVKQAGCMVSMTIAPPPAVGGIVAQNINPFTSVLEDFWGRSVIPTVADMCDQAIGVYENLRDETGLVSISHRETIDISSAIERSMRPAFRLAPPAGEKDVQDQLEIVLNVLGVAFTREQDTAPVGARAFKPDFVIEELDLAIEVKLAKAGHSGSKIQEELAADIAAYRTRWRHIIFVVYDLGVIADPDRMRRENMRHFGVSVLIIKH